MNDRNLVFARQDVPSAARVMNEEVPTSPGLALD